VSSNIVTCREAYDTLNAQWAGLVDAMGSVFGRQLYPNQTAALAKAKLFADLPVAYQYLTGVSANATEIFKQTLTINAMSQAMHSMSGSSGAGNVDVYAQTRADIQTERTYGSIASNAMKWVPLLNVVLTVLFYALFPVLFPLFLLPKTGPVALKGYVTGFFYLAAWGPLFVILHMMLMYKGAADMSAVTGSNGLSLQALPGWPTSTAISVCWQAILLHRCRSWQAVWPKAPWRFLTTRRATSTRARTRPRKRPGGEHRQRLARQHQLRKLERPHPPVRARHDRAELHLWRAADADLQRHRGNDHELPGRQLRPDPDLQLSLHADAGPGVHGAPFDDGIAGPRQQRELCQCRDRIDDQRGHEVPRAQGPVQPRRILRERDRHLEFRQHPDRIQRGRSGIDQSAAAIRAVAQGSR
jgi:hypothetical protein